MGVEEPYDVFGMKPRLVTYKASALSFVILVWPNSYEIILINCIKLNSFRSTI